MKTGRVNEGAVDIFATLLEECINTYSDSSLEAAACFYEYGNALFRAAESISTDGVESNSLSKPDNPKEAAANAAQARLESKQEISKSSSKTIDENTGEDRKKLGNLSNSEKLAIPYKIEGTSGTSEEENSKPAENTSRKNNQGNEESEEERNNDEIENQSSGDDYTLALEMMENAYGIFEEKLTQHPNNDWILHQMSRTLQGLGDVLRVLPGRTADAADAYSRALPYLEEFVKTNSKDSLELNSLADRRLLVEANILVAEALLECEAGKDVVTSETKDILVMADERVDFARGYYDKARDELQETVFLMGRIAATGADLGTHKEDICFAATLLMGVGETLAVHDEEIQSNSTEDKAITPIAKKHKSK